MLFTALAMSALAFGAAGSGAVQIEKLEVEPSRHVRVSWSMPASHVFARLVAARESPREPIVGIVAHEFHGLSGGAGGYGWGRKHIDVEDSGRVLRTPLPLAPGRYKIRLGAAPSSARDDPFPTVVWSNIAEITVAGSPETAAHARSGGPDPQVRAALLPRGIKAIRIGHARRKQTETGSHECSVQQVEGSAFGSGTSEVTFAVDLEAGVRSLEYKITGPGPALDRGIGCSAYAVCAGQVCQTQYGWSNRRSDGRPLAQGTYKLTIVVDGRSVERGFSIR